MKRVITVEVDIPNGDVDYAFYVESASPWDILAHGNVVYDALGREDDEELGDE